jgi:spore coat polysaccharide biosynthesis protein SpsF
MLCIVQSRMSSRRLPGKMMLDVKNRVLLGRVVDRLVEARKISKVVVATSDHESDQAIADFCGRESILCVRGPLDDVVDRFRRVIEQERAHAFVRINGDSPLIDPVLVDRAIGYFEQAECDLVTNVLPRTFPKGQSVEVLLSETFLRTCPALTSAEQREHVTGIYYEDPSAYRIVSFTSGMDLSRMSLSVDTPEDLSKVEAILERSGNRPAGWRGLASLHRALFP